MSKKFTYFITLFFVFIIFSGCGNIKSPSNSTSVTGETNQKEDSPVSTEQSVQTNNDRKDTSNFVDCSDNVNTSNQENTGEKREGDYTMTQNNYYGALKVVGTKLCDQAGNPVQLRGISSHGLAWYPQYINEGFIANLANDWNANILRLAMYTAEDGGYCTGGDKEGLKKIIDDGINYATQNNMYVIVDWHILSDNNPYIYIEEAKKFFAEISAKYASHENVLYEICNEPNSNVDWNTIKGYANEIIPIIRQNSKDAIILVGTPNWCQFVTDVADNPITGWDNIMYSLHFYSATHKEDLRNTMLKALDKGVPIFVSEFGISEASGDGMMDVEEGQIWVDLLDEHQISYVAWALGNKPETVCMIKPECEKICDFTDDDLTPTGVWIRNMLRNKL